jgi:hypothetical protein
VARPSRSPGGTRIPSGQRAPPYRTGLCPATATGTNRGRTWGGEAAGETSRDPVCAWLVRPRNKNTRRRSERLPHACVRYIEVGWKNSATHTAGQLRLIASDFELKVLRLEFQDSAVGQGVSGFPALVQSGAVHLSPPRPSRLPCLLQNPRPRSILAHVGTLHSFTPPCSMHRLRAGGRGAPGVPPV